MSDIVIWHNPNCSTSRKALDYLRANGHEPEIFAYMKEKPDAGAIRKVLKKLKLKPSGLLRRKEAAAKEAGLDQDGADENDILAAMADNPRLIERPVIITPKGAVIARPLENIDAIL